MLSVQTNMGANTALKNINTNSMNMNKSLERLSSGFRINNAADDSAGFAVSSKLDAQSSRLKAASLNASQAQAMVKMADAGVNEIQNMVSRIQTLSIQASSANNAGELGKLDAERVKLESAINKIANSSNFNGVNLLNGIDASTATAGTAAIASTQASVTGTGAGTSSSVISGGTTAAGTATGTVVSTVTYGAAAANDSIAVAGTAGLTGTIAAGSVTYGAVNNVTMSDGSTLALTLGARPGGATAATAAAVVDTNTLVAGTAAVAPGAATAYTAALSFQVGADNNVNNQVGVNLTNVYTSAGLGLSGVAGNLNTQAGAQAYVDIAKGAMNTLVTQRADLGATQNQVAFIQSNLATSIEQTAASVSSIRDADMAAEMADFTKNKILTQASTSMLAQANQAAQNVLSLFR